MRYEKATDTPTGGHGPGAYPRPRRLPGARRALRDEAVPALPLHRHARGEAPGQLGHVMGAMAQGRRREPTGFRPGDDVEVVPARRGAALRIGDRPVLGPLVAEGRTADLAPRAGDVPDRGALRRAAHDRPAHVPAEDQRHDEADGQRPARDEDQGQREQRPRTSRVRRCCAGRPAAAANRTPSPAGWRRATAGRASPPRTPRRRRVPGRCHPLRNPQSAARPRSPFGAPFPRAGRAGPPPAAPPPAHAAHAAHAAHTGYGGEGAARTRHGFACRVSGTPGRATCRARTGTSAADGARRAVDGSAVGGCVDRISWPDRVWTRRFPAGPGELTE